VCLREGPAIPDGHGRSQRRLLIRRGDPETGVARREDVSEKSVYIRAAYFSPSSVLAKSTNMNCVAPSNS
jgi:hypothetical protein